MAQLNLWFTMLTVYVRSAAFNSEGTKSGGLVPREASSGYGIWVVEPRFSARNDQVLIAISFPTYSA